LELILTKKTKLAFDLKAKVDNQAKGWIGGPAKPQPWIPDPKEEDYKKALSCRLCG